MRQAPASSAYAVRPSSGARSAAAQLLSAPAAARGALAPAAAPSSAAAVAVLQQRLAQLEAHFGAAPRARPDAVDIFRSASSTASTEGAAAAPLDGAAEEAAARLREALAEMHALDERLEALELRAASAAVARAHQRALLRAREREHEVRREQQRFAEMRKARAGRAAAGDDGDDFGDDNESLGGGGGGGASLTGRSHAAPSVAAPASVRERERERPPFAARSSAASVASSFAGGTRGIAASVSLFSVASAAPSRGAPALPGAEAVVTTRPQLRKEAAVVVGGGLGRTRPAPAKAAAAEAPRPRPPPPPARDIWGAPEAVAATPLPPEAQLTQAQAAPAAARAAPSARAAAAPGAAAARHAARTVARWGGGESGDESAPPRILTAAEEARLSAMLASDGGDEVPPFGGAVPPFGGAMRKAAGTGES